MKKRDPGFWSSAKVQSLIHLAIGRKISWNDAAKRINALTPRIKVLDATRIRWRGTHAKVKGRTEHRRKVRRTRKVAPQ
jgi:hypothetical protein